MPSRTVTCINAPPGTKLVEKDDSRTTIHIYLPAGQDVIYISDNNKDHNAHYLQPGEGMSLLAVDGWDVTREWYGRSTAAGGSITLVTQHTLPAKVMEKLEEKGITSTHGAVLLLALLGVLS